MNNMSYFIIGLFVGVVVTAFNTAFAINHFIDRVIEHIPEVNLDEEKLRNL